MPAVALLTLCSRHLPFRRYLTRHTSAAMRRSATAQKPATASKAAAALTDGTNKTKAPGSAQRQASILSFTKAAALTAVAKCNDEPVEAQAVSARDQPNANDVTAAAAVATSTQQHQHVPLLQLNNPPSKRLRATAATADAGPCTDDISMSQQQERCAEAAACEQLQPRRAAVATATEHDADADEPATAAAADGNGASLKVKPQQRGGQASVKQPRKQARKRSSITAPAAAAAATCESADVAADVQCDTASCDFTQEQIQLVSHRNLSWLLGCWENIRILLNAVDQATQMANRKQRRFLCHLRHNLEPVIDKHASSLAHSHAS